MEPPPHSEADLVAIPVKSLDLGIPLVIGTLPWKPIGDQWMPFKHVVLGSWVSSFHPDGQISFGKKNTNSWEGGGEVCVCA